MPPATGRSYRLTGYFQGGSMTVTGAVPFTYMMACDHRSMEGLCQIQQYLERWVSTHSGSYPPASTVTRYGGVGKQSFVKFWPSNPWNHGPMAQSNKEGDFTYTRSDGDQTLQDVGPSAPRDDVEPEGLERRQPHAQAASEAQR